MNTSLKKIRNGDLYFVGKSTSFYADAILEILIYIPNYLIYKKCYSNTDHLESCSRKLISTCPFIVLIAKA